MNDSYLRRYVPMLLGFPKDAESEYLSLAGDTRKQEYSLKTRRLKPGQPPACSLEPRPRA
jgi:hypothetical protein